jgi:hypothetical protein
VCLDLAIHSRLPEPPRDSFRRKIGCLVEPRGAARLDLVP